MQCSCKFIRKIFRLSLGSHPLPPGWCIGVDLTGILGGRMAGLNISPAIEAKNTFSYIVMQVIWCLKFCNMTKSGGQPPLPVIYAHGMVSPRGDPHSVVTVGRP